jgi:hypothetical protein
MFDAFKEIPGCHPHEHEQKTFKSQITGISK